MTADGPRQAITYVMTENAYLGLPSPRYLDRIEAGFRDWQLPAEELCRAVHETRLELERRGVGRYAPEPKRMRAAVDAAA